MLAILSSTYENADQLSDALQSYWGVRGAYQSITTYEAEVEFMESMHKRVYDAVILLRLKTPLELVAQIRSINPECKIGIITDNQNRTADDAVALACWNAGVEMMLPLAEFEQPLKLLSKMLNLL